MRDDQETDRDALRGAAYACMITGNGKPVVRRWRTVITDTESLSGFGPVCPVPHRDLGDGLGRDDQGAYDCCPRVVETFSVELAAFMVAVLNRDAAMNPRTVPCQRRDDHWPHDRTTSALSGQETVHCPGRADR